MSDMSEIKSKMTLMSDGVYRIVTPLRSVIDGRFRSREGWCVGCGRTTPKIVDPDKYCCNLGESDITAALGEEGGQA